MKKCVLSTSGTLGAKTTLTFVTVSHESPNCCFFQLHFAK